MKRNTTKTKLIATIISMVCALCLLAVGVFATLTNFRVAIANQLSVKFDAVEGQLFATRMGDVAGTDRTTSKVLSESTNATSWLGVYNGASGVNQANLDSIQEKINFVSNDKIKEIVNGGRTYVAITYYFYYVLPENSASNTVTLTAPAVANTNIAITYSYVKATSSTLPDFTSGTALTNGQRVQVDGGEHLFIKAEAKVDLSKSVKIEVVDWNFTLNFDVTTTQPASSRIKVTDEPINGNYFYYVELGEYPQTVVEDSTTVSVLNALGDSAKTGRTFTVGGLDDSVQTAYEEYTYDNAKYVKVASAVVYGTDAQYKFSTGTKATTGSTYWFKVEPIKWFLLEAYSTTKTAYTGSTTNLRVISEKILTAKVMFEKYEENKPCNAWGRSNIRIWLNSAFYASAFSTSDKENIVGNTTRYFGTGEYELQDDYTVTTGGSTSGDIVWLLSYYEARNTYYGANMYLNKSGRYAYHTDFAVTNNLWLDSSTLRGYYWLRSAGVNNYTVCYVYTGGDLFDSNDVRNVGVGVRPALTISL